MLYLKMLFWTKIFLSLYPPSLSLSLFFSPFPLIPPLPVSLPHLLDCKVHEGNYCDFILFIVAPSGKTNTKYTVKLTSDVDFPGGPVVKNLPTNTGDVGSIPGSGKPSGKENGDPLQYSCLGDPMERGGWKAAVHGITKELVPESQGLTLLNCDVSMVSQAP